MYYLHLTYSFAQPSSMNHHLHMVFKRLAKKALVVVGYIVGGTLYGRDGNIN